MRIGIVAALLATVSFAEQILPYQVGASEECTVSFPDPGDQFTFTQISGQENFNIIAAQTKGDPDPIELGKPCVFTIAGLATHPIVIDKMEFVCCLLSQNVYDEKYAPTGGSGTTTANPGTVWSGDVTFDIPPIIPPSTYDIIIRGLDPDGNQLFSVTTAFKK